MHFILSFRSQRASGRRADFPFRYASIGVPDVGRRRAHRNCTRTQLADPAEFRSDGTRDEFGREKRSITRTDRLDYDIIDRPRCVSFASSGTQRSFYTVRWPLTASWARSVARGTGCSSVAARGSALASEMAGANRCARPVRAGSASPLRCSRRTCRVVTTELGSPASSVAAATASG